MGLFSDSWREALMHYGVSPTRFKAPIFDLFSTRGVARGIDYDGQAAAPATSA